MNERPRYVTLQDYLRVVRERRWLIAIVTLVFAGAAVGWSLSQSSVYQAEASVFFQDENVDTSIVGTVTDVGGLTPEQRAALSAASFNRPEVAERARRILRTRVSAEELRGAMEARPEARTHLVVITARWADARFASRLAGAAARAAIELATEDARDRYLAAARAQRRAVRELGRSPSSEILRVYGLSAIARLEESARLVKPAVLTRAASTPAAQVSPQPVRNTVLGLLLGLTVALVVAFVRDALDRRFRGPREMSEELKLPLLGLIRDELLGRTVVSSNGRELTNSDLEAFRILRANVEFLDVDSPPRVLLVTSALPEEGKSTVAAALAATYARAEKRTLLVECDLRRPQMAERLGLRPAPGLTDYLAGAATPSEVLQTLALPTAATVNGSGRFPDAGGNSSLVCIVAGTPTAQPAELLSSERCQQFFARVSEAYDVVIIDSSPTLAVVDPLELLPAAHAVVLCVRASQTTREPARAAKAALEHLPHRPTGIVVTGMRGGEDSYQYDYSPYSRLAEP